ncbi:hypothetical protein [Streptosporangium sp. NPDC002721]|uniref:hypothetical protein n=1 Tax=Streptosporangium sp. NPDC002721 TaxID=3366188 RepID=UPI0036B3A7FE
MTPLLDGGLHRLVLGHVPPASGDSVDEAAARDQRQDHHSGYGATPLKFHRGIIDDNPAPANFHLVTIPSRLSVFFTDMPTAPTGGLANNDSGTAIP